MIKNSFRPAANSKFRFKISFVPARYNQALRINAWERLHSHVSFFVRNLIITVLNWFPINKNHFWWEVIFYPISIFQTLAYFTIEIATFWWKRSFLMVDDDFCEAENYFLIGKDYLILIGENVNFLNIGSWEKNGLFSFAWEIKIKTHLCQDKTKKLKNIQEKMIDRWEKSLKSILKLYKNPVELWSGKFPMPIFCLTKFRNSMHVSRIMMNEQNQWQKTCKSVSCTGSDFIDN